ncbi:M24 family metallopeptidase [Micromonospora sp. MS34]|uniref:M24 family metallopeptidase n=1 Tax=Micromonospora sp. MS34 TaxID=3385971 RepID=UPI0039A170B9
MTERPTTARPDESGRVDAHTGDIAEKLARLAALARVRGLDTLVLREPATISWLTGARSHVPQTLDTSCMDIVVEPHDGGARLTAVTNSIEAPRLRDTELVGVPLDWAVLPWWSQRTSALPVGPTVGSDRPVAGMTDVRTEIAATRRQLTPGQAQTLAGVCADAARATTVAAGRCRPGMTEYAAAAVLAEELLVRELDPVALFVAADGRGDRHRHPLPTTATMTDQVMLVCCARRDGLIASVTRIRCFAPPDVVRRETYRRLLDVEAAFLDATRVGARIGQAFTAGTGGYPAHGFSPTEWHRHHQGGFSGWQPREYPAHPGATDVIAEHSVVAWNPSGGGWKVEDTCLVVADGPQTLVHDPEWPAVTVAGRTRPDLLIG